MQAHEGYFKCLVMGKQIAIVEDKKEERLVIATIVGMTKKKGTVVNGINKKRVATIWDEQWEE
jgi:hypothetical protein